MITFTYTTRRDAIQEIESRLGKEGSREIAERMFNEARISGWAATDGNDVLTFTVSQAQWDSLLMDAAL